MYHRIVELDSDPWGLAVSPAHFEEHLAILRSRGSTISLPDLASAIATGHRPPRRPIVITVDDGYADNVTTALPLLERYMLPATVFLATGAIGSTREFWWDELERVFLEPRDLPETLHLEQAQWSYRCTLGADATYSAAAYLSNRSWRTGQQSPTSRHIAYYELWRQLYPLPDEQKRVLIDRLLEWAGLKPLMRSTHRLISLEQTRQLSRSALIEIGAHTVTHPALSALSLAAQTEEIQRSKDFLEELVARRVSCFSYPHGDYDSGTVAAVRAAGFTSACSTAAHTVSIQADRFALPRFQVLDWSGDEFQARIREWQHGDA
jgi:peptidoglycan/xylan/chitin deacetylase (PgdA/CDA1 family)